MIWNTSSRFDDGKSPVVSQITAEIAEICADDLAMDPARIEELAKAVESFIELEHNGEYADSRYIVMLASRALSSIGESAAGRRLLVFGTGLVKPSEWVVTGTDAMWILDLKEMVINESSPLELVFFGSLLIVIESVAEIWDKTGGNGVLGLKNVLVTAEAFLGAGGDAKKAVLMGSEIKLACENKLEQLSRDRKWEYVPRVMNLDI